DGGGLRVAPERLSTHISAGSRADMSAMEARVAEPLRILVAGQTGAGKSSLINALANAVEAAVDTLPMTTGFIAHRLTHEGLPAALVIDTPGLGGSTDRRELLAAADNCDMGRWGASAGRAARAIDGGARRAS